jgi:hypothetical protein
MVLAGSPVNFSRRCPFASAWRGGVIALARTVPVIAVCLSGLSARSAAQGSASLSAGVAGIRYADSVSVIAATVSPTLRFDSGLLSLAATGTQSRVTPRSGPSVGTSQGEFAGSVFLPTGGPVGVEILARGGMSAHQDHTRTGEWQAGGRAHLMRGNRGLWLGAELGETWDSAEWRAVQAGDAGAWIRSGGATFTAVATPTAVSTSAGRSIRYTDVELSSRWLGGPVELGAMLGTRAGDAATAAPRDERVWGTGSATVRLGGPLSLVASAGSYPVDFVQGFPGGRYVSLALGFVPRSSQRRLAPGWRNGVGAASRARRVTELVVERTSAGLHRVRVRAPGVSSVEIAGDFSAWQPVALQRAAGDWWEAALRLPSGNQEIAVRTDRGAWAAPPGLVVVADELGGFTGLIAVP